MRKFLILHNTRQGLMHKGNDAKDCNTQLSSCRSKVKYIYLQCHGREKEVSSRHRTKMFRGCRMSLHLTWPWPSSFCAFFLIWGGGNK